MDRAALARRIAEERPRFLRAVRRRVPHAADAEDIVQRAMIRATSRAGSLVDPARVRPWLARIVRHAIVDFYRERGREVPADSDLLDAIGAPSDANAPESANVCRCTAHLLSALKPSYAEVLRRVDVDDEPTAAVAGALGVSPANLHVRLHRARKALRGRVEAHCGVASGAACLDCACHGASRCGPPVP